MLTGWAFFDTGGRSGLSLLRDPGRAQFDFPASCRDGHILAGRVALLPVVNVVHLLGEVGA
ncbi:MAG: hypothetical protein L0Z62_24585 [Gemmataceae bacterium]|nr:hypothetical protein [Gemmataceae bacterium]